jgi:hypothetical protein
MMAAFVHLVVCMTVFRFQGLENIYAAVWPVRIWYVWPDCCSEEILLKKKKTENKDC